MPKTIRSTTVPYMPLFVADYMADTTHLTTLEHGAYLLLIMSYWQSKKPLRASNVRLASVARMSNEEWAVVEPALREFFDVRDGRWFHKRVEIELERLKRNTDQRRAAGIASGIARNARSTSVQRPNQRKGNDRDRINHDLKPDDLKPDGEVVSKPEVVSVNGNGNHDQHQSISAAFGSVVGRPMKPIDVELLRTLLKTKTPEQVEAGIYIAGIRARGLGKKPGSLAYFQTEIEKAGSAGIKNFGEYLTYLKRKLARTPLATGAQA